LILPDINVLVYAFRKDSAGHRTYRAWLDGVVNGDAAYGMSPQVLSGLLRIVTHPRIFTRPSGIEETLKFADLLLAQPQCRIVQPGPQHWRIFSDLCRSAHASGNLVQDAWLAALAIESGCQWITADRDFARFPGLKWAPPF
jgi:toxin-antitoxin system PIN domain toxin